MSTSPKRPSSDDDERPGLYLFRGASSLGWRRYPFRHNPGGAHDRPLYRLAHRERISGFFRKTRETFKVDSRDGGAGNGSYETRKRKAPRRRGNVGELKNKKPRS